PTTRLTRAERYYQQIAINRAVEAILQGDRAAATHGVGARRERTRPEQFLNVELTMPSVDNQRQRRDCVWENRRVEAAANRDGPPAAADPRCTADTQLAEFGSRTAQAIRRGCRRSQHHRMARPAASAQPAIALCRLGQLPELQCRPCSPQRLVGPFPAGRNTF